MIRRAVFIMALAVGGTAYAAPGDVEPVDPLIPVTAPSDVGGPVSAATVNQVVDRSMSRFSLTAGASVSRGDYGSDTLTTIWSVPLAARFAAGNLRLSASIPLMRIKGSGTVFTGIDSTPIVIANDDTGQRTTRDGLGDLTLGASYLLPQPVGGFDLELSGRVKVPTASDSSRLSSGKTDFSLGAEASKTIGPVTPFVSATYRFLGDTSDWQLKNGFALSAGTTFIVVDSAVAVVSYNYGEAASDFISDSHEIFAGISTPFANNRFRLTAFGTAGLSHGAADVSGGLSVAFNL